MSSDLSRSSFQWLHDKIAQREASGARAYLTVGLCDLKSLLDKADAAEGLAERIEELRRGNYGGPPHVCQDCDGPHSLDCSLPSEIWNQIADPNALLCHFCIDKRLTAAGITCDVAEFYFVGDSLASCLYEDRERIEGLAEALTRIKDNAESWHGPDEESRHARALKVIAGWADEALARFRAQDNSKT